MPIQFITGNKNKVAEIQALLPDVAQLDIDLPEIQDIDAKEIIREKLKTAQQRVQGELMVEDTSLYLDCLNGLPGPLIKWFEKTIRIEGLAKLPRVLANDRATAKTIIGYSDAQGQIHFFEGEIKGKIVEPRGEISFGWDPIFLPDGFDKTFAEMDAAEKVAISMRTIAVQALKQFLNNVCHPRAGGDPVP